jgi:hypothetical protein
LIRANLAHIRRAQRFRSLFQAEQHASRHDEPRGLNHIRLHRAGEGAAFTGLKPSGGDVGPAIPAADVIGSVEPVRRLLMGVLDERLNSSARQCLPRHSNRTICQQAERT